MFSGNDATFSVGVSGSGLSYQWQLSTDGGGSFSNIPGENASSLLIQDSSISDSGNRYRAIINSSAFLCNSLISDESILTVSARSVITNRRITYRVKRN